MADTSRRIAGTAYLTVDGVSYTLQSGLNWSPSQVTRETQMSMDADAGYIEKPMQGFIEGVLRDGKAVTVRDFNAMTNVTVMVELANGKLVVGRNMWTVQAQEVDSEAGTFKVRWESPDVQEV